MYYQISQLDNETLLQKTKSLAIKDRELSIEVLHHLREINRRRLYATRGFCSIFDYTTKELGYADASAQRKISAMRLLTEIPEVEEKIMSGDLTLYNAAQAQKFFQTEAKLNKPISTEEKKEILGTLENKSTREAEKTLIGRSSQPINIQKPDKIKPVTPTHSEIRFVAEQTLLDQLDQIKGLLANKKPNLTLAELITEMAKLSLEKLQPKAPKPTPSQKSESGTMPPQHQADLAASTNSGAGVLTETAQVPAKSEPRPPQASVQRTRYIPAEIKRAVYHRDEGKCCYVDPVTQRRCGSRYAIQYDHKIPFARGGATTVDNLEVICAIHNRLRAIEAYGEKKMSEFLKSD